MMANDYLLETISIVSLIFPQGNIRVIKDFVKCIKLTIYTAGMRLHIYSDVRRIYSSLLTRGYFNCSLLNPIFLGSPKTIN